jgi:hypothetical protein
VGCRYRVNWNRRKSVTSALDICCGQPQHLRRRIQKSPDWVDSEIYAYNNKHSLKATQEVTVAKLTRLTHKITIQLDLVAERFNICSSRSRRPVRKLLDTPSYSGSWWSTEPLHVCSVKTSLSHWVMWLNKRETHPSLGFQTTPASTVLCSGI